MRKTSKILGAVMAAIMIMSSFSMMVTAAEIVDSGSLYPYDWAFYSDNELKITCTKGNPDLGLISKEYRDKVEKVSIEYSGTGWEWFSINGFDCNAKSLSISFSKLENIEVLMISDFPNVTDIDMNVAAGAKITSFNLSSVGIQTVDFLGDSNAKSFTVDYCSNLKKVVLTKNIESFVVYTCPILSNVTTTNSLKEFKVYGTNSIKNVSFPSGMDTLVWHNYAGSEITIPKDPYTQVSGEKLEKAVLESGRTKINRLMFYECSSLKSVNIPNTVTSIEYKAFCDCYNLRTLDIPSSVNKIGDRAFYNSGLQKVSIPKSVTSLNDSAFSGCRSLTDVYIEGSETDFKQLIGQYRDPTDYFGNAMIHYNSSMPGWKDDNGTWRYYDDEGKKVTGWKEIGERWYFFEDDGAMATGWKEDGNKWYYLNPSNGARVTGWKQISGKWYYFDAFGEMCSNQACLIDNKVYVFKTNGEMVSSGWYKLYDSSNGNTAWFYCGSNGVAATGWKQIDGKWYYFYETGSMAESVWLKDNGKWYYINSDGTMYKGWKKSGDYWYFLKSDGTMAANEYCDGYWLDADGKWTYQYRASWKKDSKGWWYGDSTGWYAKNRTLKIDGKDYKFDASGYCTNP
ncbi:leucine-rich repeat protein [Butyrivibrio sp. AE2032]|uniref:leucine-rich repeat protein n=1 Tax=Butyrivibrio sp. AE2032 TaxID=1458463 RepID=UPI00068B1B92|nr:leucine-rich repeat protein [Butyrivibrio sp. AE2032]